MKKILLMGVCAIAMNIALAGTGNEDLCPKVTAIKQTDWTKIKVERDEHNVFVMTESQFGKKETWRFVLQLPASDDSQIQKNIKLALATLKINDVYVPDESKKYIYCMYETSYGSAIAVTPPEVEVKGLIRNI